jgi:GrpB-like predicted nucleotidyltransferase (UPF0157 family)
MFVEDRPQPYAVKVVVTEYDPRWPAWFATEDDRIRSALGSAVVRLEHVGSTSVPGLAAKPVIDIALILPDTSAEDTFVPALQEAGYRFYAREPEFHEHRLFYSRLDFGHERNVNLHVYTDGCIEFDRYLVFRDWLRANEDDRLLYQHVKQDLAKRDWAYVQDYADAKTDVIKEIRARAGEPDFPSPRY